MSQFSSSNSRFIHSTAISSASAWRLPVVDVALSLWRDLKLLLRFLQLLIMSLPPTPVRQRTVYCIIYYALFHNTSGKNTSRRVSHHSASVQLITGRAISPPPPQQCHQNRAVTSWLWQMNSTFVLGSCVLLFIICDVCSQILHDKCTCVNEDVISASSMNCLFVEICFFLFFCLFIYAWYCWWSAVFVQSTCQSEWKCASGFFSFSSALKNSLRVFSKFFREVVSYCLFVQMNSYNNLLV